MTSREEAYMRIALIQQSAGPDKEANLSRALLAIETAATGGAELVGFAELAFEPFYPRQVAEGDVSRLAEPIPGPTTDSLSAAARRYGVVVVANLFERDGSLCYDTSPVIDADGTLLGRTRMVHITEYEGFHEQGYYAPGNTGAQVFNTQTGQVGVAICYDRHFPEYLRALALNGANLVVVPQAGTVGEWPNDLYEAEMRVAAFQNGYFVALCNRVGREGSLDFAGESFVCGPDGRVIARAGQGRDEILFANFDTAANEGSHARKLFLRHRRPELYGKWLGSGQTMPG
jgi:beta-ureidopropionase